MDNKKYVLLMTSAAPSQSPFSTTEKRPPIGLGFLISVLRNAGHEVFFIDNYLQPSNFLETDYLQKNKIDYVGIYANTICYRDTLRMFYKLDYLRRTGKWSGKIMVGGPHTTVALHTIPDFVDYVVQGEGEQAILDIVEDKVKDRVVRYPTIKNLDKLPMPAWDYFIHLPYKWSVDWFKETPVFTLNTSRGCPFKCTFCSVKSIWGKQYTCFSAERVVSDIEYLIKNYGAKGIYFREDNFTLNKKRLERFCNLLIEKKINIPWSCETRVNTLDRETVDLMHRAGARAFYFGVESGSQKVLDFFKKEITIEQTRNAFKLCHEFGIKTAASIIVGVPTETEDDITQTIRLVEELKPTVTWFNVFVGIPDSELYQYAKENKLCEFIDDRGLIYLKGHNERVKRFYGNQWDAYVPLNIDKPMVSVIMSVYNSEKYLEDSVKSMLSQTHQDFEFIIINDASTDGTEKILKKFDDPRIKIITNHENLGLTKSLNKGIKLAKGKYIARMDADDISLPQRLETQVNFLEKNPDYALVGSSYYQIDGTGKINTLINVLTGDPQIKEGLKKQNWFGHGSVMMRKDALLRIGGYDERFKFSQDYDLWLKFSELYKIANIDEPLYCWRATSSCISNEKRVEQKYYAELAVSEAVERRINKAGSNTGDDPTVSVIVPTYNRPNTLSEALDSILNQTFKEIEIVVVNDAGADVENIVSSRNKKNNITYIRHGRNRGLAAARNTGIKVARGKYVAYLDDDDLFYPEHIETLVNFLDANKEYKAAYTDAYRAHQEKKDGKYVVTKKDVPHSSDFDYDLILRGNFIPVLCVMHERSCLDEVGCFDETLKAHEDWDLWMRMSRKFRFRHIKKLTCEFSWREDASSMTSGKREDMLSTWRIVSERGSHYLSEQESQANSAYQDIQHLITAGRHDDALVALEKLVKTFPGYALAHNDLGVLYFNSGDRERALNHYEKAAQLNPENITFQKNLADFYFVVSERVDDALKIYLKILDKHPGDIETLLALGQICTSLNRIDDARFLFSKVLELEPRNINAIEGIKALHNSGQSETPPDSGRSELLEGSIDKAKRVSIIIPVYNKVEFTIKCLDALNRNTQRWTYELIIIDNASTDGTKDFLRGLHDDDIKVITNEKNLGFAKACNQGARAANADYILFLNNDTEPQPGWLLPLLETIENDPSVGAVGSKLLFPDGTIQHAGVVVINDKKLPDPLVARHLYYQMPGDLPDANQLMTYQALTAASLLVTKSTFEQVQGFDEGYWNGYEDIDLCFKLQEKGLILVYQAKSVVVHHESKSGPERFTKVKHNIDRLHNKWLNKIRPDLIIEKNGSIIQTEAELIVPYLTNQTQSLKSEQLPASYKENLVSIVILTFNQLKYTMECVESIINYTPELHEIIFVDNGSTDGTLKWLRQLVKENSNYKLIENKKNLGFAKGCNQGITASSGEYILLLNNDVVVTEGWLSGMIECLNSSPDIGIVGPMTNNISGPQKVENVGYPSTTPHLNPLPVKEEETSGLDEYAKAFKESNRHRRIPMRRVVGFCMLFKRALVDKIGLLDEGFGTGNFEDDDLCLRAALEGYRNMIAGDVFIHHYGSISFIGNRIDYCSAMANNKNIFSKKWSGIDTNSSIGKNLMALKAMEKADELNQTGQLDKAVDLLLQEGIRYSPDDRRLYFAIAEILVDAKHFKDALDTINEMPGGDEDIKKLVITGYCKQGMEQDDEAEQYADRALSLDPHSSLALNLKGIIAHKKGKLDAAEEFFKRGIESDNGYGEPYTNLGVIRWAAGEKREGLDLLEKGVILSPKVTDIISLYHAAITETGEFERAEKLFRELKSFYPINKTIFFLLIDSLIKQGKSIAAMQEIESAIVDFGADDGMLAAALEIRKNLGPHETSAYAGGRNSVSLCMIVKNEERHIAKCLMSLKPIVDEIVIVDTGSSDRTKGITTAFGAKVFDFPWTGNFSDARNFSLSKASGKWIFVMDADEVISPLDHAAFIDLAKKAKPGKTAYKFVTRNYITRVNIDRWKPNDGRYITEEAGAGWSPSNKVRLFPNNGHIRFENPVHELVEPSLIREKIAVLDSKIPVHHYGKLDKEKERSKGEQYFQLGKRKLNESDNNLDAICELAIQAGELEKYDEALELWQKAISINPDLPVAFMNIGYIYLQQWMYAESLAASKRAMELKPDFREAISNYSVAELCGGDIKNAISTLEGMLKRNPNYLMAAGILSAAYCCDGQRKKGLECLAELNKEQVVLSGLLGSLARQLIAAGKLENATLLLEAAVESNNINADIPGLLTECYRRSHNATFPTSS